MSKGLPNKKNCDRCGNDLQKGTTFIHLPYKEMYIALCHICYQGLLVGFWKDFIVWQRDIENYGR